MKRMPFLPALIFLPPIVDDAKDFGRIAACNALSDIYAMGGTPLFALNIIGFPVTEQEQQTGYAALQAILSGGEEICRHAGISIAGGHSINVSQAVYGLAVIGTVSLEHLKRNDGAQAGDDLILGKPLGIGILAAGIRQGKVGKHAYQQLLHWATRLNQIGHKLAIIKGVNAMTDVTGFGLLGHLSEMCKASSMEAVVDMKAVPLIQGAQELVLQGLGTAGNEAQHASLPSPCQFYAGD